MDTQHLEWIGLALFVASEIVGISQLKSNSLLQLLLTTLMNAYPYQPKRRRPWDGR